MTDERWNYLMNNENASTTIEEFQDGWHFCYEFDGLLRNNKEEDFKCTCIKELFWCNTHQRLAERCKEEGGILIPCKIVNLTGLVEIEES